MKEISVQKLAEIIAQQENYQLLDIREDYEFNQGHLQCKNLIHIPMEEVIQRRVELDADKQIIIMCKSGKRASALANYLSVNFGIDTVSFVTGGIKAYANEIDNSIDID